MIKTFHFLNNIICLSGKIQDINRIIKLVRQQGYCIRELPCYLNITDRSVINIPITDSDDMKLTMKIIKAIDIYSKDNYINTNIDKLFREMNNKNYVIVSIKGNCMEPYIMPGTIISIKSIKNITIHCNSIILFSRERRLYLHRVIEVLYINDDKYFLTKGDNAILLDRLVSEEQVIGIYQ